MISPRKFCRSSRLALQTQRNKAICDATVSKSWHNVNIFYLTNILFKIQFFSISYTIAIQSLRCGKWTSENAIFFSLNLHHICQNYYCLLVNKEFPEGATDHRVTARGVRKRHTTVCVAFSVVFCYARHARK